MRKIIFIIGISLVVACSKDKDSTPNNLHTYQATVKENFTDLLKGLRIFKLRILFLILLLLKIVEMMKMWNTVLPRLGNHKTIIRP